jgi:hypothetical protein
MIKIERYIRKTKKERQAHLRLKEPCIKRGGNSASYRGILAFFLDTTIPSGAKIHICHACDCELCSNPRHLYWVLQEKIDLMLLKVAEHIRFGITW